jgi:hypothetical protein
MQWSVRGMMPAIVRACRLIQMFRHLLVGRILMIVNNIINISIILIVVIIRRGA